MGYRAGLRLRGDVPELAESWEVSRDKLQIIFKLRQGVKFQNRDPVNGREFDAEDVIKSWENFNGAETPNNKAANRQLSTRRRRSSAWRPRTSTRWMLKLAEPAPMIFQRLSTMITGEVGSIYPKEVGDSFDAQKDQIGTGGW